MVYLAVIQFHVKIYSFGFTSEMLKLYVTHKSFYGSSPRLSYLVSFLLSGPVSPPSCGCPIRQRRGRRRWQGEEEEEGGFSVYKTGPGAGGGHAAWQGEMPLGAGQLGSGGGHQGCVDPFGKRGKK